MSSSTISLIIIVSIVLGACSNKEIYNAIQANQHNQCRQLPKEEYEKCLERTKQAYEKYEAERQEAIKKR